MNIGGDLPEVPCTDDPQAAPAGSTLSLAGSIVLPAGNWTGVVHVLDTRKGATYSSPGTVTMVKGAALNDGSGAYTWSLLIEQDASVTETWPQPDDPKKLITLSLGLRFSDDSTPSKEIALLVPFPVSKMLVPRS